MALDLTTARTEIARVYIAAFDRAPDAAGLTFWVNTYMAGTDTLTSIAEKFTNSTEYKTTYPSYLTNEEFVEKVYVNVFNRASDAAGKTFWADHLTNGTLNQGTLMKAMIDAAMANSSSDGVNLTAEANAGVAAAIAETYTKTLTSGNDNMSAMIFEAPQTFTPGGTDRINSLQDNDKLTGTGTTDVLNATIGVNADTVDTNITPVLTAIETVNVAFDATGYNLDLQDSTGMTAVNITRMDAAANNGILNMKVVPANLSVASSAAKAGTATFSFLDSATADTTNTTTMTLKSANLTGLTVQSNTGASGIETINMVSSTSANTLDLLTAQDVKTLNISGDQNLKIGAVGTATNAGITEASTYTSGLANVDGSLTKIDASTLTGNLDITLGTTFNAGLDNTSGVNTALSVIGGTGNDTFRLMNAVVGTTDSIAGGTGTNTLQIVGTTTVAAATSATITDVQSLDIRTGHDAGVGADTVTIDADAFNALANVTIRNEGQNAGASAAEGMTVNLNDLTSAQANAITVLHGTTGNSTIANNVVNVALKTATAITDTASFTIADGINNETVFNAQLNATAIEKVTITDSDTESNTIHLTSGITSATTAANNAGSSTTLVGGAAGQYMNLDSNAGAAVAAAVANVGYGYDTTGTAGSATTATAAVAAIVGVPTTVSTSARDNAVSSVFNGNGATAINSIYTETINASAYVGDVIVRLGEITRVDGVTSQNITTSTGNDTFIFDAVQRANAGFTSGDTIAASTGTDTLVIDGDTSLVAGTPVISIAKSEWDNLTGVDVLRFGTNTAGYSVELDNEFVNQTDSTSRLTIVNNDGRLNADTESTVTVNARGLDQTNFITFIGANNVGTRTGVNTIQLSDVSANSSQILNGGDTDVRVSTTAGYVAGNNNVYQVWNTANVSVNDLSQTSNFDTINFTNDQAADQTLTLTLNNTIVEAMVDSSNTATTAGTQEIITITATDNAATSDSILNVNASQVTGFHGLNITGSAGGNDTVYLDANVGGTASTIALGASTGDTVHWTGGSATMTVAATTLGNAAFTVGAVTTTHTLTGNDNINLSNLTYATSTLTDALLAQTYTLGSGVDTLVTVAGGFATVDTVSGFAAGTDVIQLSITGLAGSLINNANSGVVAAGTAGVVQHITAATPTVLAAATNIVVLDGTFTNIAAALTGIQTGGTTALTQATAATANDDFVIIWSDGTNGHISLLNDANTAGDVGIAAEVGTTLTDVMVLSGLTSVAGLTSAQFSFIA